VAKPTALDHVLADPQRTEVALYGGRVAERYGDDRLAALGALPLEKLVLHRQDITKLPPLQPTLKSLTLGTSPLLRSLDGIERCTSLQRLSLTDLSGLDFTDAFDRLAELPELTALHLAGKQLQSLPPGLEKLPSLIELRLEDCPKLDLAGAFEHAGKSQTLRGLVIHAAVELPDAFASLARLQRFSILRGRGALPPSLFLLDGLHELDISWGYKVLPPAIGKLAKLEVLRLRGSRITVLPDELCDCLTMQLLDAEMTLLRTLPRSSAGSRS